MFYLLNFGQRILLNDYNFCSHYRITKLLSYSVAGYEPPENRGLNNFEVVYFPGGGLF